MKRYQRTIVGIVAFPWLICSISWEQGKCQEQLFSGSFITIGPGDGSIDAFGYAEVASSDDSTVYVQISSVLDMGTTLMATAYEAGLASVQVDLSGQVDQLGTTYAIYSQAQSDDDREDITLYSDTSDSSQVPSFPAVTFAGTSSDGSGDVLFQWNVNPAGVLYSIDASCNPGGDQYYSDSPATITRSFWVPGMAEGTTSCSLIGGMYGQVQSWSGGYVTHDSMVSSRQGSGNVILGPGMPAFVATVNLGAQINYDSCVFGGGGGFLRAGGSSAVLFVSSGDPASVNSAYVNEALPDGFTFSDDEAASNGVASFTFPFNRNEGPGGWSSTNTYLVLYTTSLIPGGPTLVYFTNAVSVAGSLSY